MSHLVLNDVPSDLLVRLDAYAKQHGISSGEAASLLLSRALPSVSVSAASSARSTELIEQDGVLLHAGQLTPGSMWPDVSELREERADELLMRTLEGRV